MVRTLALVGAIALLPVAASAQQPCTANAQQVVDQVYRRILERPADAASAQLGERLANGTATVRDLVREVAKSPEHIHRFVSGNDAAGRRRSVEYLYRHLLGREGDPDGVAAHTGGIAARGADEVVDAMLASDEYQQAFGDSGVPGSTVRYCGQAALSRDARVRGRGRNQTLDPRFRAMDRNGDGIIARDEWQGTRQAFRTQDANRDGVLSGTEVRALTGTGVSPVATAGQTSVLDFASLDANGDGRVERREWSGRAVDFNNIDLNGNGVLTSAEVANGNRNRTDRFGGLDINRDNKLSFDEWDWSRRSFDVQDVNRDGVITRLEFNESTIDTSGR
jgi:Ca2+-binding EF-hand superfamily protein